MSTATRGLGFTLLGGITLTQNHPRPSPELAARRRVAEGVLSEYEEERRQAGHPTDYLSLAIKLANALRGLLEVLGDS